MQFIKNQFSHILRGFFSSEVICGYSVNTPGENPSAELPSLFKEIGLKPELAFLHQIHSEHILKTPVQPNTPGDGLISSIPNLALVIKTADCMPILIHHEKEGWIAALHMGWKSAQKGILHQLPDSLADCKVLLNPGLRKCCYEVGTDFLSYDLFRSFIEKRNGKNYFDPVSFVMETLSQKGLSSDGLFDSGICTFCHPESFYSYRRNKDTRRTFHFILLQENKIVFPE